MRLAPTAPPISMRLNNNHTQGSALAISLFVMAILMLLSLGVSSLILSARRDTASLLHKTRAWYAAESGLEHALYKFYEKGPGFEETKEIELEPTLTYGYDIVATAQTVPDKEEHEIKTEEDHFGVLPLNGSVTIPLFYGSTSQDAENQRTDSFRVEFYVPPTLQAGSGKLAESLDILRWKIFGISKMNKDEMEVINEFSPMQPARNSPYSPSCVGTDPDCWNGAEFYKRTGAEYSIAGDYHIKTFLQEHDQNFLVLTNIINIDLISGSLSYEDRKKVANIRYRIVPGKDTGSGRFTLPQARITADGFSRDAKQTIEARVSRDIFLPVFNFALYRTKIEQ